MRHRTTFVLLFLFVAGLAALWWVDRAKVPTREQQQELVNRLLPEIIDTPLEEIQRIAVVPSDPKQRGIVAARREGGRWQILEPIDAAADPNLVETLVRNLKDLRKSTDSGTIHGDPAPYGLDRPRATLSLFGRDPAAPIASLDLGKTSQDRMYVRPGGVTGIEVVDARLLGLVDQPVIAWRDRALFRVPSFRVASLAIQEAAPPRQVELIRRAEQKWQMTAPIETPADSDKVEGLVAELAALHVADGPEGFVADDVKDLAPYGLVDPWMTLTLTPFQGHGNPQVVKLGKEVPGRADHRYALRSDQNDVMSVSVKTLREAYPGPTALRSQKVTDLVSARVNRIRIDSTDRVFDLARAGDRWQLLRPSNEVADSASVQTLLAKLDELKTSEFLEPAAVSDARLDPPSFRVRVWQAEPGAAPPAPTASDAEPPGTPRVDLRFGRHDAVKKTVYGQVAGDPTVLALPDAILQALPRNEFAFRDLSVVTLDPASIERLTIEREETTVTVRAPGSGRAGLKWRMVEPTDAPADEQAVTTALLALANLRAASWEGSKVGDGRAYGLDAPKMRVRWTLHSNAPPRAGSAPTPTPPPAALPPRTLRLGKVKPGTNTVYANIEGEPGVFSVNPSVVVQLGAELHDRTVMSFPAAQAQRVILRWPARTLALRRRASLGRASDWEPEPGYDPSGFNIARFGAFVSQLSDVKTPLFLQYCGAFPARYGLESPRLVLEVWTTRAAEAKVLRIGTGPGESQAVATSATGLDGAAFVISTPEPWSLFLTAPRRLDDLPADPFAPPVARP